MGTESHVANVKVFLASTLCVEYIKCNFRVLEQTYPSMPAGIWDY